MILQNRRKVFHRRALPGKQFPGKVKIGIIAPPRTHTGKFFHKTPFLEGNHRLTIRQRLLADLVFDGFLNVTDLPDFAGRHKCNGFPLFPGTARAPHTVNVDFRTLRNGIVDHMGQIIYIDPPGGNIGSNQQREVFCLEPVDDPRPQNLRHIPVESLHRVMLLFQLLHHLIHIPFGAAENQRIQIFFGIKDTHKSIEFVFPFDGIPDLIRQFRAEPCHFRPDDLVILHELFGNAQNLRRHGGGKHQHSFIRCGKAQDLLDVLNKTHIQHFISFIQNRIFQRGKIQHAPLVKIFDAPRGADDHIHIAFPQKFQLDLDGLPAVKRGDPQITAALEGVDLPGDLHGKFTGGRKDQRLRFLRTVLRLFNNGDPECRSFTGPGLCLTDQIFVAGKKFGNGQCLDL